MSTNHSALFYCQQVTATNDISIECAGKTEVSNIQDRIQGEEVCAFVEVDNRTIQAGKVFFNAVCGGPQVPPQ